MEEYGQLKWSSRNPLKSGQCFLRRDKMAEKRFKKEFLLSQSPQIGSMFLTAVLSTYIKERLIVFVAIPSNRVNVSYIEMR